MLVTFWQEILFRPIFNLLIYLYNEFTLNNLGLAIIYLTIIVRVVLLPFSLLSDKGRSFYKNLAEKIREIDRDYGRDYIKKKEMVRDLLRQVRLNPWSSAVVLGVQLLVLVLLYQVFVGGINAHNKLDFLYPAVARPDFVNTQFLWFDLGRQDLAMCVLAGIALFIEISLAQSVKREILSRKDQIFRIVFPLFTIIALWILPAVKAVFILTSLIISIIMILIFDVIIESFKQRKITKTAKNAPDINIRDINIKRIN